MATDIDLYVERKSGPFWEHVPGEGDESLGWGWYDERDYRLFGLLAGVRDQAEKAIISPRGAPPDLSKFVYDGVDDTYSKTWYMLRELQAVDWEGLGVGYFAEVVKKIATVGGPDDVRVVIGFD